MALTISATTHSPNDTCFLIKTYLNFSYFVGLSPHRFKFKNGNFVVYSWWPQKIYCVIAFMLTIVWVFGDFRSFCKNSADPRTPDYYLELMRVVVYCFQKCTILIKFWINNNVFLETLNFLQRISSQNTYSQNNLNQQTFWKLSITQSAYLLITLYILIAVMKTYFGEGITDTSDFNLSQTWKGIIDAGKYNIFLENNPAFNKLNNNIQGIIMILALVGYINW